MNDMTTNHLCKIRGVKETNLLPSFFPHSPFVFVFVFGFGHAIAGNLVHVVVGVDADLVGYGAEAFQGAPRRPYLFDALEAAPLALHVRRGGHAEREGRAAHDMV